MIHLALGFLCQFLNNELNQKLGLSPATESVKTGPLGKETTADNKIHLTLIHIEEENILKNQNYYRKADPASDFYTVINPEIKINLYILFSALFDAAAYTEALRQVSFIMSILQGKNTFGQADLTGEASVLESLMVELHTQTIEQENLFWISAGHSPVPSVMYKVRLLLIQDDRMLDQVREVTGIGIDLINKM